MEQLLSILSYLPLLAIIVGGSFLYLYARKNETTQVVMALAIETFFYYLCDAQFVNPNADPQLVILACSLIPSLSPFAMAFLICYIWKLYYEKQLPWHQYLWFAAPIAIFSVCLMLYMVVGAEDAGEFQQLYDRLKRFPDQYEYRNDIRLMYLFQKYSFYCAYIVYATWTIGLALFFMVRTGFSNRNLNAFLFKKASLPPTHILMLSIIILLIAIAVRMALGRSYLFEHPGVNILVIIMQACCIILITLSTFCVDYVECTLRQVFFLDPKEDLDREGIENTYKEDEKMNKDEMREESDEDKEDEIDDDAFRLVQERLEVGLHEMMEEKKAYLDCELRLVDVARQLGTNRNYLSRHINEKYHINFNEYLNRMRIEYSKDYMLRHPEQLLDTIAIECGFSTAQSFGRKFKAMEGMTPRSWLVTLLKTQKKS